MIVAVSVILMVASSGIGVATLIDTFSLVIISLIIPGFRGRILGIWIILGLWVSVAIG